VVFGIAGLLLLAGCGADAPSPQPQPIAVSDSATAQQLDGPRLIGGGSDAACAVHEFKRGILQRSGYRKSGGYSETDPDAAFYRAFFADPLFRLPPGQWRISVVADGFLAECAMNAPRLTLKVSADILVR
jgi:hypothetical protein